MKPMTHKLTIIIMALAGMGVALATQANAATITFSFQENGSNLDLGPTSTFTRGGFSLTASAFLTTGGSTHLYAKNLGSTATTGLGTTLDPSGEHEIVTTDFIQLALPTSPPSTFNVVMLTGIQSGEQAKVYFTHTAGTLSGATLIGTLTANGSVTVPAGDQSGFIDVTAGAGNVLLACVRITSIPPGQIGDTVFCDLNGNGVQDAGEPGLPGVKVTLSANCSGHADQIMFTDSNGKYLFTNLPAGNYCVTVDTSTAPSDCSVPECPTTVNVNLGPGQVFLDADFCFKKPPCPPPCVDPQLGLGAANGCTVLELGTGKVSITGPAGGILGDICMAPNSSFSISGDEYVTGTVKLGVGATASISNHSPVNIMNNVDLSAQINAANNRAASAAALSPTQTFTTLDGKTVTTINGVAGLNVIKVTNITLAGTQIYLNGPAGARFIINVTGNFTFTGGGSGPQIRAAGGVQPEDILFNVIGSGSDVAFSGGGGGTNCCVAIVDGTLLAPNRKINLSPGLVNGEVISGKDINIVSGSSVRCPVCQ